MVNISVGDYNIGLFQNEAAEAAEAAEVDGMMLQNHDASNWRFTTVVWDPARPPLEVDQVDGRAKPAMDAAPHVPGFQVALGAGEGRFYLFGR